MPLSKATIGRRAADKLRKLRAEFTGTVRLVLDARVELCDPACKGWFIDHDRMIPVRCDECASLNHYGHALHDDDVALLPEAQKAQETERADDEEAES